MAKTPCANAPPEPANAPAEPDIQCSPLKQARSKCKWSFFGYECCAEQSEGNNAQEMINTDERQCENECEFNDIEWGDSPCRVEPQPALSQRTQAEEPPNPNEDRREIDANGCEFVGQFVDGLRHGHGVYKIPDGGVYEGQFHKGQLHGYGKYTLPDGRLFAGQWVNSRMHGHGIMTMQDKSSYSGQWRQGIQAGSGVYTNQQGRTRRIREGR
eukprot:gnl/MRDRNA2_/MRDRNA2_34261_c0_seq1.p1 gnl/MRDRNA2_/MRDRNA2_34261_c0~~gnl/MRDRNA2_/MRDRNA2_34261_c0_seq1.p1  ORF type:complete len:213 (-),score=36.81 gnl/MRDRNA2_/MRDRNA2_34261_c0_seq1:228-866(-)